MRSYILLILLGVVPASAAEAPLRALLVCGGCCHDYQKQAVILRDGIQARANVQVDVIRAEDSGTKPYFPMYENKDWAKGYNIIIHDECSADIKDLPYVQNILDAHKAGLPALNLHCAMHSYRTGKDIWFEFLGIQSSGHGWQKPISIDFTDSSHPITKGMKNWTTVDEELYNNVKVFDTAKPLALGSQIQGNGKTDTTVVAWTNDYHGTRVFNTTLGHNNQTVEDDRYLDLLVNGLLWSCDKLNSTYLKPYKGAPGKLEVISGKRPAVAQAVPQNATVVTASASSVQDDRIASLAVDGDGETRWCADGGSFPQWYQLDFEKAQKLSGVKIAWEDKGRTYQYQLEGSKDGKTWSMLADSSKNEAKGDTTATFTKTEVKAIRITATGSSEGGWASINEISLQGDGVAPLFSKSPVAADGKSYDDLKKRGNITPTISKLTSEQEAQILKDVSVADGFDVTLFSTPSEANYPVYVASAPNGDLYVASDGNGSLGTDPGRGRILRLRDSDNDGRADQVTEFVKNVDSPRGIVWDHDRLYVVHPPDVTCYIDTNGDGVSDKEETLIKGIAFGFDHRTADHTTNGLSLGIDGWLYIAGGDFGIKEAIGTDGRHVQHRAGGVLRFRPDGSGLEIFSTGTRNILGTPISPLLDLFSRDNTNDGGGWDVRFHHFTGLEDHGYPRMYMNFGDEIVKPLADYGGGSGCGSAYLSEPGIPEKWNNAPLTCDWGTGALWKHTVEPNGATFKETAKPEPLVKMTRPTDADVDGMSRIYQASWKGATFKWEGPEVGYIVRVSPKGYTPETLPDFEKASDAELVKLLESPSQVRTLEAQRALLRRPGNAAMRDALLGLAGNAGKPLPARVAALYALTQRAVKADSAASVIKSVAPLATDPALQRFVLRALGDAGLDAATAGKTTAPAAIFTEGLKSNDPRTRLEAIIGATRQNMLVLAPQITSQLGDPDPVVAHTAFRALGRLKAADACFRVVDTLQSTPAQRTGALRALMRMHEPEVVSGLVSRLGRTSDPAARSGILGALARLYFHEGEWKGDSWGTRPDTRGPYYQPEPWSETPKIAQVLKAELAKASPAEAPAFVRELQRNRIEFNESLERIMTLAKSNPTILPDLVSQLASVENLPASATPYLIDALKADQPARTVSQAVILLAKTDSKEGCIASLGAIGRLHAAKDADKPRDLAKAAFLSSQKLENHHQLLEDQAEKLDGDVSLWADAALISLSERKDGSPEARELSKKALDHGWESAKRRVQILKAVQATGSHRYDDKVREEMESKDAAIAAAAKAAGETLKLEKKGEDKTPLVSTMDNAAAIAQVMKTKGSVELGKQIFSRQSCTTCHAASLEEVQKGPFLGTIAQTYTRDVLAENIMDPGKTIAQGFATEMFTLKDGSAVMGFITLESAEQVKARDISGKEYVWKVSEIAKRDKLPNSLMPPGLVSGLTIREFASLLDYLESLSKKQP
ncbi:discoidin domain-containing protein [Luteolibacter yonseiensis]|uniref:Discoidin domain-containing protein n=1 Tax=Luteolibacter yonseiensis TaxID=1144680 RepID=A0A934R666_9BACT|nr:discoidin domain-containing protein [Luteolibacter yonseiensis]MBK1816976.1 discoidin domain-containing protein [Luteolibacter yonseiensis]